MPGLFQSFFEALQKSNHRHGVGPPPGTRLFGKSGSKKASKDDSKKGYKTWHFCAYKGCKSQSEAYAKGRNYGFLASPYCSDHVCRHWDHGQPCKNPTKRDEPLCDIHKECSHPRCGNIPKLIGKTKRSPWCLDHGCVKDGCKNQKEIKSASLNSKYCLKHTCVEADCLEMSDSALNRCEKHTCAFATCLEPVTPGDDAVTKYCARHRQCKAATCNQDVQLSDGRGPLPYCKDHYCAFGHDCDEPRHGTSTACEKHICRFVGCNNKRSSTAGSLFCSDADHECKVDQCTRESFAPAKSGYCLYHICREYLPPTNCASQGDQQKGGYCDKHERCVEAGCNNFRFVNGSGDRQNKCEDHLRPCDAPGCDKPKVANGRRCNDHICLASNDCQGIRVPLSTYCSSHKCTVPSCPGQRRVMDETVPIPTLMAALNPTGNALQFVLGFGAFCAKHTCAQSNCAERTFNGGKFCALHTCRYQGGCGAEVEDQKRYCAAHMCQSRNCNGEVIANGQFCVAHTCHAPGCTAEAQTKGRYAGWCHYHEEESSDSDTSDYCCSSSSSDEDDNGWGNSPWPGWPGFATGGSRHHRRGRRRRRRRRRSRRGAVPGFP